MYRVADLPDVITPAAFAAFLGISPRAFRERRARSDWPFDPIPGFPPKGKAARWSKVHVAAVLTGGPSRTRRSAA